MAMGGGSAGLLVVLLMILLINLQAEGRDYNVGGSQGWGFVPYKKFSATKFKPGDALVFKYPRFVHDVVQVGSKEYNGCVVPKGARKYTSGLDRIVLKRGVNYFICSIPGHCQNGMKLKVQAF